MNRALSTGIGKLVKTATRFRPHGGQALPGLVVEKLFPSYFADMVEQLPEGVIVITGTNGKTTTTKMVVELLEAAGKEVLTNPTGSNLIRGIVSSLLTGADWRGKLPHDIAVFEIDEAYARHFVKQVRPRWVLALNVSRDQLDRFGEVDVVAELVGTTMRAATEGVVTNANDPRLAKIGRELAAKISVSYFGVAANLESFFPSDNELVSIRSKDNQTIADPQPLVPNVELTAFQGQTASYAIAGKTYQTSLQLTGQHNFQNAAAAVALVRSLLPEIDAAQLIDWLGNVGTAFGRGEIFTLKNGSQLQLVLVKNPASFRQTLASYLTEDIATMIVINDNYADSRDVSWLWDVDFVPLKGRQITATSGSRAADMALRLHYADIKVTTVEPDIDKALQAFCKLPDRKIVVATYTAMLHLYEELTAKAGESL
ncbi:MAG: Mur ligase middle domain protein [Candidatus Saccharibacteria bacterium]|nr:Mur ligase middle domain protein [Candidatus Saccharibacteria bacterium]